ncbi:nucleolar DEAD-box protein required for synthesis of 60S ribosomal subunit [Trapelia coarctata]|nr:nucleolar DEAD-box protein required for synthesis of 60S ribosomal subunit [Trapelia coarctata]
MAPLVDPDDDFVFTISDNDEGLLLLDEDEDTTISQPVRNGTKRKRDAEISVDGGIHTNGQSKKQKKNIKTHGASKPAINGVDTADHDGQEEETTWAAGGDDDGAMNSDFEFQVGDVDTGVVEDFDGWGLWGVDKPVAKQGNKKGVDIDELVARRRKGTATQSEVNDKQPDLEDEDEDLEQDAEGLSSYESDAEALEEEIEDDELLAPDGFGMGATGEDEESDGPEVVGDDNESENGTSDSDEDSVASPVPHPADEATDISSDNEGEDPTERLRREAFFAPEEENKKSTSTKGTSLSSFQSMSLSRPILRGLASVGFTEPTPIQAKTIPVALLGKDVVGGAVTGSGKTAAFMIPILERLLYRPKKLPTSRVAILMPTRELAVQCFNVGRKLASFTDITFCQLVGGFSLREQENVLRTRPDILIATPGRFIDHMRNSPSFTLDTLEILVLDEADRMLEDGFADELNEILTTIPKSRQTMLFSATMTSSVDKLIHVGLNRPVRLLVDAQRQTVQTLTQEFVRLRPGREPTRIGHLLHLVSTLYTSRVIIFFRQKKEAHRLRIIFALLGFKAAELHGSMSQEQRIASIEAFRSGTVTHLLATDVASRGLDIKGVETVINYEAPQSHEIYLHRVGRTARAGRIGRACTIAAEPDRKVVKAAVKTAKSQHAKIVSRVVEAAVADEWVKKVEELEEEVEAVMKEEKEEKAMGVVEREVHKGENLIEHEAEIKGRPRRTWFESERDKQKAKEVGAKELNGEVAKVRKKEGKLSNKDKKKLDDRRERGEGKMWKKGKEERGAKGVRGGGGVGKGKGKGKGGKEKGAASRGPRPQSRGRGGVRRGGKR